MLTVGSRIINYPVLSLHVGGEIARTRRAIIAPESLKIIAYELDGPLLRRSEVGYVLETDDVRELSPRGLIVDSIDDFVRPEDVRRLDEVMALNFDLEGLKVVTEKGKKLGKVVDYTFDTSSFMVYQIIVQRPLMESLLDPQLTINRSQIVEIDDYTITIRHEKEEVRLPKETKPKEFVPNFTNPFKEPNYAPKEEGAPSDSDATISE